MNETIRLKPVYLIKGLVWIAPIGIVLSLVLFLCLKIDLSYRYFLSMILVFIALLVVFYMNKEELEKICIIENKLEFHFFNKVFFKRKPCICDKQDIETQINDDTIIIFKDKKIIARIRSTSISNEVWIKLKAYFMNVNN